MDSTNRREGVPLPIMIICGTGHRPNKLGGYDDATHIRLVELASKWLAEHPEATTVISGGALGWDQALAGAAIVQFRILELALPFPGFEDRWPMSSKAHLYSLIHTGAKTTYVCEGPYAGWKMQERNKWMVDHADQVLALWDGSNGGTSNCIRYANKVGKPITNLWDVYNDGRRSEQEAS